MGKVRREDDEGGRDGRRETGEVCWYLDGEDLYCHVLAQQLRLPHAAEAPPGLHLDELQGLMSQDGGGGRGSGVLRKSGGEEGGEKRDLNN